MIGTLGWCFEVNYAPTAKWGIIQHRQTLLTLLRRRLILYVGNRIIVGIRSARIETAKVEIFVRRGRLLTMAERPLLIKLRVEKSRVVEKLFKNFVKFLNICLRAHSTEGERVFHDGRAKRAERGAFGDVLCDVLAVVGGRGRERFQRLGEVRPLQKIRVISTKSSAARYTTLSHFLNWFHPFPISTLYFGVRALRA